jgi:hypothetical protein
MPFVKGMENEKGSGISCQPSLKKSRVHLLFFLVYLL